MTDCLTDVVGLAIGLLLGRWLILALFDWIDRSEYAKAEPPAPWTREQVEADLGPLADWQWQRLLEEMPDRLREDA